MRSYVWRFFWYEFCSFRITRPSLYQAIFRLEKLGLPYIALTDHHTVCASLHSAWPIPIGESPQPYCVWASEPIKSNPTLYQPGGFAFVIQLRYMVATVIGAALFRCCRAPPKQQWSRAAPHRVQSTAAGAVYALFTASTP